MLSPVNHLPRRFPFIGGRGLRDAGLGRFRLVDGVGRLFGGAPGEPAYGSGRQGLTCVNPSQLRVNDGDVSFQGFFKLRPVIATPPS
jgi:hypothetical protein